VHVQGCTVPLPAV